MRDLRLVEIDLKASKMRYEDLKEFLNDKPLMLESLNFIMKACTDKINFLEGIISIQEKEIGTLKKEIKHLESIAYNYDAIEILTDKLVNRLSK